MTQALRALFAALIVLAPSLAFGQGAVLQSGPVVPGDIAAWLSNGIIRDGGSPAGAGAGNTLSGPLFLPSLGTGSQISCLGLTSAGGVVASSGQCGSGGGGGSGTVNNGTANSLAFYAATGNAVSPLGLGANFSISGNQLLGAFLPLTGGGVSGPLTFSGLGSGTQVSCLGLTSSNAVVPSSGACGSGGGGSGTVQSGTTGQIPAYNSSGNTVGPLTGALALPGALTLNVAALSSVNSGQTITGSAVNSGSYTAATIYAMACPGCTGFVDGLQSIGTTASSFTGAQKTGFASYFVDNDASSAGLQNSVGFFTVGVAAANNAAIWGINTLLTDNTSQTTSSGTGKILFNELDFNATSTGTTIEAIAFGGASLVQPASANAITCHQLGVGIVWNGCVISQDGHVQNALYAGLSGATSGDSLSSQPILFESTDASGNRVSLVLRALTGDILSDSGGLSVAGAASVGGGITSPDGGTATSLYVGLNGSTSGANVRSQLVNLASTDSGSVESSMSLQASAGSMLTLKNTASNVATFNISGPDNVMGLVSSSTGNPVAIEANGSDTNVGLTVVTKGTGKLWLEGNGPILFGSGIALALNATTGFPLIPTTAGVPTGVVGASGQAAIAVDTADNEFCWSAGSWFCVASGGGGGGGNWTAAPVGSISGGLSITSGVLTDEWDGGLVTAVGTGLSIDGSNNLNAQWSAGTITGLSGGLSISGTTLTFSGSGSGNVVGPGGGSLGNDCTSFNGTTGLLIQDAGGFCLIETSINPGDANYSIQPTNFTVATTTLTAARTWTLPAAASTNKSHIIRVADWGGAINATDTITIMANGSDTVNGGNSLTLSAQWSECDIQAAGTTSWLATCTLIPAYAPVANQFLTGITAAGVWSSAQPAFTDISGQATLAQLPTLAANTILGRGSSGVPQQLTLSGCSISGTVFSCSGGGGSTPGGSTNSVQYNAGSSTFGGVSLTSGEILIGGATVPSAQTVSGDGTLSATGVLTIDATNGVAFGTSATVNTGTSGATIPLLNGTNTWSATQTFGTIGGYKATISGKGGTYTLTSTDCGTVLRDTSAVGVTFTLPNSLPIGCQVAVEQGNTGQITFSPASGASLSSAHSYTKTFGQYSIVGLMVDTNTGGTSATYVLSGDGS